MSLAIPSPGSNYLPLSQGGLDRRTLVHIPPREFAALSPIVVLLHGSGGTGEWALRETRWDELADREGVVVVAPTVTRPDPTSPIRFFTNPPVWNDGSQRPPADRVSADDVGFIAKLLDELPRRFPVDPARVFITGFSNGAAMTFRLAAELSDRIAAIAPVAGHYWPMSAKPTRPVPTLFMIGDSDLLIPLHGGRVDTPWGLGIEKPSVRESLQRWSERLGGPTELTERHDRDGVIVEHFGECLEAWTIAGLGHHWPGGRGELNPRIAVRIRIVLMQPRRFGGSLAACGYSDCQAASGFDQIQTSNIKN